MSHRPIDLTNLRTVSLADRESKVSVDDFAHPLRPGARFSEFLDSLPKILFGRDLRRVVDSIANACKKGRPVIFGMGAHVIKCGLNPIIIDLLERGIITCLAMNGAGAIHDVEVALAGHTSEDVSAGLKNGTFGMARESGEIIHDALADADREVGLGIAIGRRLLTLRPAFVHLSLLATAARLDVPASVHVALGTDIVHMRAGMDGALLGRASFIDFRLFAAAVHDLSGGVYINAGSAVILPEVFLKAFTIVQNLGAELHDVTTVDLDMMQHYRPMVNVVQRPAAATGGHGYALNGRHELLIPLIAGAVVEGLESAA